MDYKQQPDNADSPNLTEDELMISKISKLEGRLSPTNTDDQIFIIELKKPWGVNRSNTTPTSPHQYITGERILPQNTNLETKHADMCLPSEL